MRFRIVTLTLSLAAAGCAPSLEAPDPAATLEDEVRARTPLDVTGAAQVVGASADGRFVAYGVACDAGDERTELRLRDDDTGRVRTLARGWSCQPGGVQFSPDGRVATWGGDGTVRAVETRTGRAVVVSREGLSGIGVTFSPDSRWFVVASLDPAAGAALDAWSADLGSHVEVARGAYASPFGGPTDTGFRISPDGSSLLYLGGLTGAMPVGSLTLWHRPTRSARVLAEGVPATSLALTDDWRRVAYVQGVAPFEGPPTETSLQGDLAVRDLSTGRVEVLERGVTTALMTFARGGASLVYVTGGFPPGSPSVLKACALGGRPVTLDDAVFPMYAPARSVVVSPRGDTVAWSAAMDPTRFVSELRSAAVPTASATAVERRVVATEVVPGAYGFNRAGALVYLHAPTASFPLATGTLSALPQGARAAVRLGEAVPQVGLRIEATRDEVLFFTGYDLGMAIGTLELWDGRAARARRLGARASVMSLKVSPGWDRVGSLTVATAPEGEVPRVSLRVARLTGASSDALIARDVTSFHLRDEGRVLFTTERGLFASRAP